MTQRPDQRPHGPRRDREEDLKATTGAIQEDAGRLLALEARKEELAAADPEVARLSDAAVDVADELARKTRAERELSDQLR